jgi:hypothetical protein
MSDPITLPTLDANQLRWLAEKADGLRDEGDLAMVYDDDVGVDIVKESDVGRRQELFHLKTPSKGPGVPGNAQIQLTVGGRVYPATTKFGDCDAVFVTQSAIEKFLLPYYMRFKSGAEVQAIQDGLFKNGVVIAGAHVAPSFSVGIPDNDQVAILSTDPVSKELSVKLV